MMMMMMLVCFLVGTFPYSWVLLWCKNNRKQRLQPRPVIQYRCSLCGLR